MKKLLEISHLKKSFGDTEVLKDISMEVNEGEVVAILDLPALVNQHCFDVQHFLRQWMQELLS